MPRIGFGGGCHWCTEAIFQILRGVETVQQGFIASDAPDDSFSEAVIVDFDPGLIGLDDLIGAHVATHASTVNHRMRGKYRSAVYTFEDRQMREASAILTQLSERTRARFVTRVLPFRDFRASSPMYQDYYRSNPDRPFCKTSIDPKLAVLRSAFPALVKTG